ncbi:hypothetical protein [Alcaligenes faecalis]|uniref:hypothetical protein n=1 Tax=Alcaligenes faecalis TaxID=511 RepID=UPI000F0BD6C5|nr:hypothetical protein [Alcaligenes faecalis]AYR21321.1 hypothetical protein D6I95_13705 [Alcaligenes faecalis]
MNGARWAAAELPVSIRTLGARLKSLPFTTASLDGFSVDRVRDDFLDATYIEKITTQDVVTDPFGGEELIERISYKRSPFSLYSDFPNLEIKSVDRSNRDLINKLLEICNFKLSLAAPDINPIKWIECLNHSLDEPAIIESLQISDLDVMPGVTAKALLRGTKDVRVALDHLTQKKRYSLDRIQAKISIDSRRTTIQLSSKGSAKFGNEHASTLRPALREALKLALQ